VNTGGGPGTGGVDPGTGGANTGGASTGGVATGGVATGGVGTGGAATGGAPNTSITIWIAGDSTVANGSTPCPAGWGKHFGEQFGDLVTVVNSAVGGRSIQT